MENWQKQSLKLTGLGMVIICLIISSLAFAATTTVYQEDFNKGKSLRALGFQSGTKKLFRKPSGWVLDKKHRYLRSDLPKKKKGSRQQAGIYTPQFTLSRTEGIATIEWQVKYQTLRLGRAWQKNNQLQVALTNAKQKPLYSLTYLPHGKQTKGSDLRLTRGPRQKLLQKANTGQRVAPGKWLKFKMELHPVESTGQAGAIKVYLDFGKGYQQYLQTLDQSYNQFNHLYLAYQTGTGGRRFQIAIDNLLITQQGDEPPADTTPPVTSHDYLMDNQWINQPTTINFTAVDAASGVAAIYYQLGETTPVAANSLTLSTDGIYQIKYYGIDQAGNQETAKSITVKIDQTPPQVTAAATTEPNEHGWYQAPVTVNFTATDNLSGVTSLSETPFFGK